MSQFSIETFAADCKKTMARASDPKAAARQFLAKTLAEVGPEAIQEALEAAIPPGASVGEMVVHASPELTLMYARVPARFQSGIHNHTVFACIGQLAGEEISTVFEKTADGLRKVDSVTTRPGEVATLPADVIHCIENPGNEVAGSLHIYGGDLPGLAEQRTLWAADDHRELEFTFPALVRESVKAMHKSGNSTGLKAVAEAIPAARPLIDAVQNQAGQLDV